MDRRPRSSTSVTETWESRLPSVNNRWRKWRFSLILVTSSPWTGTQSEMLSAYWQGICPVPTTCPIWNFLSLQIKLWFLSHDSEIVLTARNLEDDGSCHSKVEIFPSPMSATPPQDHIPGCRYSGGLHKANEKKDDWKFTHLAKDFYGWPVGSRHSMGQGQSRRR